MLDSGDRVSRAGARGRGWRWLKCPLTPPPVQSCGETPGPVRSTLTSSNLYFHIAHSMISTLPSISLTVILSIVVLGVASVPVMEYGDVLEAEVPHHQSQPQLIRAAPQKVGCL